MAPGEYRYSRPGEMLRCPWHGWEFDVRTGRSWFDPARTRVRRFEVAVESGCAVGEGLTALGGEPGPSVAETYPVRVEERYVVVDVPG
jgi:3-phenylpropionate/trans-cinnamate dioxygenase ferredoxin subunit